MKLKDLMAQLSEAGEYAVHRVRQAYVDDMEDLASTDSDLPGVDTQMNVTPLSTLMPEKVIQRLEAAFTIDKDGEINAALTWDDEGKEHWWSRPRKQSIAQIEIHWSAHEPPEGICRIRDDMDRDADIERMKLRREANNG